MQSIGHFPTLDTGHAGSAREADLGRDGAADLEPLAHPLSGGGAALQATQGGRRRQPREVSRNMNCIID